MLKPPADDSTYVPQPDTYGTNFMRELEAKAGAIYPDHSGSREKYIHEKAAEELTRLNIAYQDAFVELGELRYRIGSLEK